MRSATQSAGGRSPVATKRHRAPERLLVVDASLSGKLAGRLRERGREAKSAAELGWKDHLDPDPECVLVTGDDRMPLEHAAVIEEVGGTIATVEPYDRVVRAPFYVPDGHAVPEVWKRDVVQRWAHAMARQDRLSIRRYSRTHAGPWTPRIRNPQGRLFK